MTPRLISLCAAATLLATTALHAAPPQVVTDMGPVHGLVSEVMGDLGTPALILSPGTSPHGHALRPSEAAAIADAGLVVWVGAALTPWLEDAIDTLAPDTASLELLPLPGVVTHAFREGPIFEAHAHDDHAAEKEEHAHEEHAHKDDHAHDGLDPHAWLDPVNGLLWLSAIADALSAADPDNAATYRANADAARDKLDSLIHRIEHDLDDARGKPFVVFHDAYHYFEARFDIQATGALRPGDAVDPGPARVAALRDLIEHENIVCVFTEPQFPDRKVTALLDGTNAKIGTLDPIGRDIPLGAGFYPALIESVGQGLADCLGGT